MEILTHRERNARFASAGSTNSTNASCIVQSQIHQTQFRKSPILSTYNYCTDIQFVRAHLSNYRLAWRQHDARHRSIAYTPACVTAVLLETRVVTVRCRNTPLRYVGMGSPYQQDCRTLAYGNLLYTFRQQISKWRTESPEPAAPSKSSCSSRSVVLNGIFFTCESYHLSNHTRA